MAEYEYRNISKVSVRETVFDVIRGFAMLCIIAGHFGDNIVTRIVFTFHVPVFFFISGYFFHEDRQMGKTVIKLLKPYLFTVAVLTIIDCSKVFVKGMFGHNNMSITATVCNRLVAMIYGSGSRTDFFWIKLPTTGAIWFFLALIWGELFFSVIVKLIKEKHYKFPLLFLMASVLWTLAYFTAKFTWLPFSVQAGCSGVLFMAMGFYCRQAELVPKYKENKPIFVVCCLLWIVSVFFSIKNDHMSIVRSAFPNPLINIAGALSAIWVMAFIGYRVSIHNRLSNILSWIGENSSIFLSFHVIVYHLCVGGGTQSNSRISRIYYSLCNSGRALCFCCNTMP